MWDGHTKFKLFFKPGGRGWIFYLCIYVFLLLLSQAFIPQLSWDFAAIGQPVLIAKWDNQTSSLNVLGFLCRVRQPMCTLWEILLISLWLFSPRFSTQKWHLGAHLKTLSDEYERFSCSVDGGGWEWVFSVYVTKRANTILLGTETKKGKSFWVDNNMTLFIEVDVYIYIIYYCKMGKQKFILFFLFCSNVFLIIHT